MSLHSKENHKQAKKKALRIYLQMKKIFANEET